MSAWVYLAIAIVLEVAGTTSMKLSDGFSKVVPSTAMILFYIASMAALTMALKRIDMSVAYAIWAGVGVSLITIVGLFIFKEELSLLKLGSILLIVVGVVGLHLSSNMEG
jgi:small multidrug resistance pump